MQYKSYSDMSITNLTPSNDKDFLEANKEALVVLIFNGEFTEQQDVVDEAVKSLSTSSDLRGNIVLGQVDVEVNNVLATQFQVASVPMVVCLKKGQVVKKIDTLEPSKLVNIIKEQLKLFELTTTDDAGEQIDSKETFKAYLRKLTTRAPVMVFMKGDPKTPRCGFSRQLMEILAKHSIQFESFDILQDEEVRQGLKEYSDWPTYPQIYVKGEFIGGLDILKQLQDAGELESTLKT